MKSKKKKKEGVKRIKAEESIKDDRDIIPTFSPHQIYYNIYFLLKSQALMPAPLRHTSHTKRYQNSLSKKEEVVPAHQQHTNLIVV